MEGGKGGARQLSRDGRQQRPRGTELHVQRVAACGGPRVDVAAACRRTDRRVAAGATGGWALVDGDRQVQRDVHRCGRGVGLARRRRVQACVTAGELEALEAQPACPLRVSNLCTTEVARGRARRSVRCGSTQGGRCKPPRAARVAATAVVCHPSAQPALSGGPLPSVTDRCRRTCSRTPGRTLSPPLRAGECRRRARASTDDDGPARWRLFPTRRARASGGRAFLWVGRKLLRERLRRRRLCDKLRSRSLPNTYDVMASPGNSGGAPLPFPFSHTCCIGVTRPRLSVVGCRSFARATTS